ncbi:glycosyltransferase family 2 protein [Sodalis endosymbiont of Spalangia cameroni]|uniref:glycosyltransferase family 2 protein n=1 Tax=Sodalis praecaptivus TaxID=1239307 RepID=UPI0031F91F98
MIDKQHIKLTYITHFHCNQENINSVNRLLEQYEKYSSSVLDHLEFIIVDDGSPVSYKISDFNLNLTWLKINEDIPWNQSGARNLGVTYAKSDKIIITDLDHTFPEKTLKYLINRRNPGRSFYKLYRKSQLTPGVMKGHSNIFFMSRARYFRHHGYDEEFAGHYGYEEVRFVKYQKYHGSKLKYLPKKIICIERKIDRDNSYHTLVRDLSYNAKIDKRKKEEVCLYGAEYGHSRLYLNFSWDVSKHIHRPKPLYRCTRRCWKHLWWFRYLFGSR